MTPTSEKQLGEAIRDTNDTIRIIGGGTRQGLGNNVPQQNTLSTKKLSGITLYEPAALTLVAKAGTPLADIEQALDEQDQQLPFEPMDHRAIFGTKGTPSIGAVAACNISGSRRIQAGACRDSMIGVRFVDGRGDIISNGGRVMKNVTGYDLVKLMSGSFGTLGVLSEISFKVQPKPRSTATLILHGLSNQDGVSALCKALGSPNDITGAAHISGDKPQTLIRIEGLEKSVSYRTKQLKSVFGQNEITLKRDASKLWKSVRDGDVMAKHTGDVWRVSLKPTEGPVLVENLQKHGIAEIVLYDWSGGLVWIGTPKDTDLRAHMSMPGHATCIRSDTQTAITPTNGAIARLEQNLREQFDPRGILNTGIMG